MRGIGLAAAVLAAFASHAQTGGALQGRVVSSVRGEPVGKAVVTLRELKAAGGSQPQIYMCETGADGRFSIVGMAPGVYDPRPAKQGFETRPPNRFATAHDFPPVTVEAGKAVTGLELRLIPDSTIAGRVLDSDGDPVRYADVEAEQYVYISGKRRLQPSHLTQTNDRGEYRMFYLPPGRYYVHATSTERSIPGERFMIVQNGQSRAPRMNLSGAFYPGVADAARAAELNAPPGDELDGIDIHLVPAKRYAIRGKFPSIDNKNDGGHGVRVVDRMSGNFRPPQYQLMFTRDGFEIWEIEPGSYLLIGDWFNRTKPEERLYARAPVDVIDRDVEGVELAFSPGVQLKGTVKVQGSAPLDVEKTQLVLRGDDFSGQQPAKIAADGTFTTPQLAPGMYQVFVAGRNAYVKSVRVGDRELPDGKIDAEHLSGEVTVVLSADFGQVEGTVTDDAGQPVYNANVTLIPDQSRPDWEERFRNVFTIMDGKFTFTNIQPGAYEVYAWLGAEPGAPQSADYRKPYEDHGVAVTVAANGKIKADLKPIVLAPER